MWKIVYAFVFLASIVEARRPRTNLTISGLSSGGAMAAQFHLAFSKDVSGAGIVAGPPYYCARGIEIFATTECLEGPAALIPVAKLEDQLQLYVQQGSADPTSYVKNDPVYIFSGTLDFIVRPDVVKINEQIYTSLGANIKTNYEIPAAHGFVTDNYGGLCGVLNVMNYMNNCSFNLAYAILDHIFGGNLTKPTSSTPLKGQFTTIAQPSLINPSAVAVPDSGDETIYSYWANWLKKTMPSSTSSFTAKSLPNMKFPGTIQPIPSLNSSGFDTEGFIYYPSGCLKEKKCPIHVVFHGCLQGKAVVGDVFARNAGYLEVGELNDIIILFPQIIASYVNPTNPEGCWDWWGYDGPNYANKLGTQMAGVMQMVRSVRAINSALVASN